MPRPRLNPDTTVSNLNMPEDTRDPESESIERLQEENQRLREQNNATNDRLSRLEFAIGKENKLRKWDEMNDAESLKKRGHVPSMDAKDPIIYWKRSGSTWRDNNENIHDEQVVFIKFHSGKETTMDLLQWHAACSGNSIKCIVNDYDAYRERVRIINEKRLEFQRSSGKTAKVNTVSLLKEIKQLEEDLRLNVTLSRDEGKTFDGLTIDIPESVFNGMA